MYDEIYRKRWDKDPYMYALLGGDGATVTFVKYKDNKQRKDILHSFFTKSSVFAREPMIQENVNYSFPSPLALLNSTYYSRLRNSATFWPSNKRPASPRTSRRGFAVSVLRLLRRHALENRSTASVMETFTAQCSKQWKPLSGGLWLSSILRLFAGQS